MKTRLSIYNITQVELAQFYTYIISFMTYCFQILTCLFVSPNILIVIQDGKLCSSSVGWWIKVQTLWSIR